MGRGTSGIDESGRRDQPTHRQTLRVIFVDPSVRLAMLDLPQ
jgi:hypothetical protein